MIQNNKKYTNNNINKKQTREKTKNRLLFDPIYSKPYPKTCEDAPTQRDVAPVKPCPLSYSYSNLYPSWSVFLGGFGFHVWKPHFPLLTEIETISKQFWPQQLGKKCITSLISPSNFCVRALTAAISARRLRISSTLSAVETKINTWTRLLSLSLWIILWLFLYCFLLL